MLALMLLPVFQAGAEIPPDDDEPPSFEIHPPPPWREQVSEIPPYPAASDLIAVEMDVPGSRLHAYLDKSALSVGDDTVVRYVLVLKSDSGAENVLYEGIRCEYREYRTYAHGTYDREMDTGAATGWKPLGSLGIDRYRKQLYKNYFCDVPSKPFPKARILEYIKHGKDNEDG